MTTNAGQYQSDLIVEQHRIGKTSLIDIPIYFFVNQLRFKMSIINDGHKRDLTPLILNTMRQGKVKP
jgi:hypothetical protein